MEAPEPDSVLAKILAEPEDASASSPAAEPGRADEITALARFMRDAESVQLFFLEMAGRVDSEGTFPTAEAVELLRELHGFSQKPWNEDKDGYNQPYSALGSLAKKGQLEKLNTRAAAGQARRGDGDAASTGCGAHARADTARLNGSSERSLLHRESEGTCRSVPTSSDAADRTPCGD